MAARPRKRERDKLLRLAYWNADGVHGRKLELEHFLNQHDVDISLLSEAFLNHNEAFRLANCLPPHRQTDSRGWYSHPGPPWYSPPLSAHSGPDPLGGYCYPRHNGRQTGENPCGLPLPFPPTDRSGFVRLFRRGDAGFHGRRPQRQTHGWELAVEHKTGKTA